MGNIKYWDEWKDFDNNTNRLEILTNDIVTSERVIVKSFKLKNKVEPFKEKATVGQGAEFSIISETKLKYLNNLYAINIKELKVIHYLNGVINFVGYLDTEQYSDNFFDRINYEIELTANNGISILNRIKLSDDSGNTLTGINSAFDIIRFALRKLDIGYEYVNIALSTTIPNLTLAASETLLHKLNVNTDNYIDEKGNIMSCREVLDSILTPLTAQLYIENNQVYIVDINSLAKDTITYKRYINTHLNYVMWLIYDSTYSVANLEDIDTLIGSHNVTYQQGVSKIDVKFNKYVYDDITELEALIDNAVSMTEFDVDDRWKIKEYTLSDSSKVRQQIDKTAEERDEFYRYSTLGAFRNLGTYSSPNYDVNGSDFNIETGMNITSSKTHLKISADVMIEDYNSFETEVVNGLFQQIYFMFKIKVADRIYKQKAWVVDTNTDTATTMDALSYLPVSLSDDGQNLTGKWIFNKWYTLDTFYHNLQTGLTLPLNSDQGTDKLNTIEGGELNIKIACPYNINSTDNYYNFRFKNIKLTYLVEDEFGNLKELENTDSEIQGTINDDYIDDASIDLIHGTDEYNNSRGGFLLKKAGLYSDSDFATNERLVNISTLNREGVSGTVEELLLNTHLSNLQLPRYIFSCNLRGYYSQVQLYKYDLLQRAGQSVRMMAISQTTDYSNGITSFDLLEVVKDELDKI